VGASQPHVSVVVDYSNEATQLLAVFGFTYLHDGCNFVFHRLDSVPGNPVAWAFQFASSEEGFCSVDFESSLLESAEDAFQLFQVSIKSSFSKAQKVISVRSCMTEALE
jgi:hypothetical protein